MSPFELITLLISIVALGLSIYSTANIYYEKHIKTKVYLRWVEQVGDQLNISLLISNMSSRPSTLIQVLLPLSDTVAVSSSLHHAQLIQSNDDDNNAWSDTTPINVPARSAISVILVFQHLENFYLEKHIKLKFNLNGVVFERTFDALPALSSHQLMVALKYRMKHNL